ncbi:hypothetical protein J3R30DRAFT_1683902 [Lentinula aciculospora]|uniref:Hyaluronan-mediated motility receptor C-terminal domain-containing protein n=1 Tax=Lentinula aciculospora TaxID=153920 RepID=A0A9W8ZVL8_9AGAR|nr:hypothetical protein J3R30DRAFT_1683902 [Lentinula aciculospora]
MSRSRAHSAESKPSVLKTKGNGIKQTSPTHESAERYAILQGKVDDLEQIHNEGKKAHQAEVERLKSELARLHKANAELTDRMDKQKKQKDALELRVSELKKISNSDKAEIKDLGVKLRMSEHQRTQMTAKHGEMVDMKKALQALETRRKEECKERDRKIGELEKSLLGEQKKREMGESQVKEVKAREDVELNKMKGVVEKLKTEIVTARDEVQQMEDRLETTIFEANSTKESLLTQLEEHKIILSVVAEQYGSLASTTVTKTTFERLKFENCALQLQAVRSSRKLGNTEAQVSELANLIRQSNEENQLLRRSIKDMTQELFSYIENATSKPPPPPSYAELDEIIEELDCASEKSREEETRIYVETLQLEAEIYHLQHDDLLFAYADAEAELHETSAVASKLPEVEQQRDTLQELLQATSVTVERVRSSSDRFKQQVVELEEKLKVEVNKAGEALQKEKETVHRLMTTVQTLRMAEDGLKAENELLTSELTDAERFQEGYYSLSEELEGLLDRNALAEDEAQRLSKVNAEIIGHHNPLQRIMYLEKIRNELSETKQVRVDVHSRTSRFICDLQKLLVSTRTTALVAAQNQELENELNMFKSVAVPFEFKPGTKFTRMTRPPLMNFNKSTSVSPAAGDMTMDEIL